MEAAVDTTGTQARGCWRRGRGLLPRLEHIRHVDGWDDGHSSSGPRRHVEIAGELRGVGDDDDEIRDLEGREPHRLDRELPLRGCALERL